jgi:hypothetical protein
MDVSNFIDNKIFLRLVHSLHPWNHYRHVENLRWHSVPHQFLFVIKYHSRVPFFAVNQKNRHVKFIVLHPQQPAPPLITTIVISNFGNRTSNKYEDCKWAWTLKNVFAKMNMELHQRLVWIWSFNKVLANFDDNPKGKYTIHFFNSM